MNIKRMMTTGNMDVFVRITTGSKYPFWPLEVGMTCIQMQFFEWLKKCQIVGMYYYLLLLSKYS